MNGPHARELVAPPRGRGASQSGPTRPHRHHRALTILWWLQGQRIYAQHASGRFATRHSHRDAAARSSGLGQLVELKPTESVDGEQMLYKGRVITGTGQKIMDEVAHAVLPQA